MRGFKDVVKTKFLFLTFLTLILKTRQIMSAKFDKNSRVQFGNFRTIADGQILVKNESVINKFTTISQIVCLLECVKHMQCLSINLYLDQPNQIQCELLNWGGTAFNRYLKPRVDSKYIQLLTSCSPNPCQNGGDCIADAGGHEYICRCAKNFAGNHCEKAGCVIFDFEDGLPGWTRTGTAFNNQPTYGDNSLVRKPAEPAKQRGKWYIGTYENRPSPSHPAGEIQGDTPTGTMMSPKFIIRGKSLKFLIGGGADILTERVELVIGGVVVAKAASQSNLETLRPNTFNVTSYRDQIARLRIVDEGTRGWGHVNVDHFEDGICYE